MLDYCIIIRYYELWVPIGEKEIMNVVTKQILLKNIKAKVLSLLVMI